MGEQQPFPSDRSLDIADSTLDELREGFFDVVACRSGCFKVVKLILVDIVLDRIGLDLPRICEIGLIADEHDGDTLFCIFAELTKPLLHVLEGFCLGEVEGDDGSNCPAVVGVCYGSEALLSCSVPDLVLDAFAINGHSFGRELHPDSGLGVHVEGIIDEAREEVGLADPRIADHYDFEEEVELFLPGHLIIIMRPRFRRSITSRQLSTSPP